MLADGSASKIGAIIGTTTTAISMKSKKKPKTKKISYLGETATMHCKPSKSLVKK